MPTVRTLIALLLLAIPPTAAPSRRCERYPHRLGGGEPGCKSGPTDRRHLRGRADRWNVEHAPVELPYSGLTAGLSAVYWQHSVRRTSVSAFRPTGRSGLPAMPYLKGRDSALEAVRQVLSTTPWRPCTCCVVHGLPRRAPTSVRPRTPAVRLRTPLRREARQTGTCRRGTLLAKS
jgi:hypothetical protein